MSRPLRIAAVSGVYLAACAFSLAALLVGGYYYVAPGLPDAVQLRDVRMQTPLNVYSRDGRLMAQFGEVMRAPVAYRDIPPRLIDAFLAAEDEHFFEHPGVDYRGVARAVIHVVRTFGDRSIGGSTITQQVARMYFLSRQRLYARKFKEAILALRIDAEFTKEEILELYLNTYHFGHRSNGVVTAARTYFGKELGELTIAEAALLAGMAKGPSIFNPISSPQGAATRRAYVLRRMHELGTITQAEYAQALEEPIESRGYVRQMELDAPYVAEMVRAEMVRRFGANALTAGYKVTTTIDSRLQRAANAAIRQALIAYDERHGYRGPVAHLALAELMGHELSEAGQVGVPEPAGAELPVETDVEPPGGADAERPEQAAVGAAQAGVGPAQAAVGAAQGAAGPAQAAVGAVQAGVEPPGSTAAPATFPPYAGLAEPEKARIREAAQRLLTDYPDRAGMATALVLQVREADATVYVRNRGERTVGFDAVAWAAPYVDDFRVGPRPTTAADVLRPGDVVRLRVMQDGELRLAQLPEAQGALVALDPLDGAVAALAGGFDFYLSNYNRAVQSTRQPGSAFKPFVYSAALEHGYTPASIVNDAPLSLGSAELGTVWKPTNDSGLFYGDTRLREALVRSQNLPSVRIVREIGLDNLIRHLRAFGLNDVALPRDLTVALGSGGVSPLDLARGYAAFANGGFRVEPYFIERIEDARGSVVYAASAPLACASCEEQSASPEAEGVDDAADWPAHAAPRAIAARNAYLMTDMLADAIRRGTGRRALALRRDDLAGKTGTTNDYLDAWFAGYNGDLVATVWVGFDRQPRPLGRARGAQESGSRTALPMWVAFMAEALASQPERPVQRPPGIVELRINPVTGRMTGDRRTETIFEKFYIDRIPEPEIGGLGRAPALPSWPGEEPAGTGGAIF